VIVRDGRISDVGPRLAVTIPKGAPVIDCTGKFLIPGLVDGFAGNEFAGRGQRQSLHGRDHGGCVQRRTPRSNRFHGQSSPHLYLVDSVGSTDDWSLLARRPDWVATLKEGAHPAELSPVTPPARSPTRPNLERACYGWGTT